MLKPLHGIEPRLLNNLETLIAQDYGAPVQIIFGVGDPHDPAVAVVEHLQTSHPDKAIRLVVDARQHGANKKISNLINMAAHIVHPLIVISDSDVALPPDALLRLAEAFDDAHVGLASCFHTGRGDAGFWSVIGAMDIGYRFMPSVAVARATGLGRPALGPTMALQRTTLDAIGGFAAFADVLADDYEIGRAVRALGLASVVPPVVITHCGDERTLAALVRHELRWLRTIYGIDRVGYAGSVITYSVPLALMGGMLTGFGGAPLAILALAIGARLALALQVDIVAARSSGPKIMLPLRDCLSFALFLSAFFVNSVDWRGTRLKVTDDGRISAV